jgi:hypothetical protein
MGLTPSENRDVLPGRYELSLSLSGYESIRDSMTVENNGAVEKSYTLAPSPTNSAQAPVAPQGVPDASKPSVKSPRKHRITPKIVLGAAALGAAAVGILANASAQSEIDQAAAIKSQYLAGRDNSSYSQQASDYSNTISAARSKLMLRNVMYGITAAAAVGFGISFAF